MATKVLANVLTVAEVAKRINPDGTPAKIAELLEQLNDILANFPAFQANEARSHVSTVRSHLPTVKARKINAGAFRSASGTKQIREKLCLLETWCEIDEQLIDHEPDPRQARLNELKAFLEATMQEFSRQIIYGDEAVDETELIGLATRYNALGANCVSAGGSGNDLTSVYLIELGDMAVHLVYPRGNNNVGIDNQDNGKVRITDANGNPYMAYSSKITCEYGLVVKDERAVQRIANVESAGTSANFASDTVVAQLIYAIQRLPRAGENAVILCNRDVKAQFNIYALNKANGFYTSKEITGKPITVFQDIPILRVDKILSTESALT